jgi:hypothetical protein
MNPRPYHRPALFATVVVCALVDIGLLIFSAWLGDSVTTGVFVFFMAGGPLTFIIAAPMYGWFNSALKGGTTAQ